MKNSIAIIISSSLFFLFPIYSPLFGAELTVNASTPYVAADGFCSIVEAIENANSDAALHGECPAGTGPDTISLTKDIVLDGSVIFNENGPNGLPSIIGDTVISGNGFNVAREADAPSFRIFHVGVTGSLELIQTIVTGGLLDAGFDNGGGIYNEGMLLIRESTVSNNHVASFFPSGGGIYNDGYLTIVNTTISENTSEGDTFSIGGGIYNGFDKSLLLINAIVQKNSANDGGGIWNAGPVEVNNSFIVENTALSNGGGMLLINAQTNPAYRIYNTTFHHNSSGDGGGAILNNNTDTEIFGSLFTENTASASGGGAIQNTIGSITIISSVFAGNRALSTAFGGAISNSQLGVVRLKGSVVNNNESETKGGGLHTGLAEFYVTDSLIISNQAESGGGFYQSASNIDGFFIERSSIVNNFASILGGAGLSESSLSRSYITNSTISNNEAPVFGGGLALNQGGRIDLLHTAVIDNISTEFVNSTGGFNAFSGTTNIASSIIANNLNSDCSATSQSSSLDYNITTGPSGGIPPVRWCSFIPLQPNDQTSTDPLLSPLAYNGNLGLSHLLEPSSPARDAIPFDCPLELEGVDQRGVARESGSCDVGPIAKGYAVLPEVYFELGSSIIDDEGTFQGPHTVELIVDNTNGTLITPGMDLSLYVNIKGTAAFGTDYSSTLQIPTIFVINAGNWPLPGTTKKIELDVNVIDDALLEDNETVRFEVSLTGPGKLGSQVEHTVTIIDDDQVLLSCIGFLPPFYKPQVIPNKSKAVIPLKVRLFYQGIPVTDVDFTSPPEVTVAIGGMVYGDENDDGAIQPVGKSNMDNVFVYENVEGFWSYRLNTYQFPTPGVYTVSVRSGDQTEYSIDSGLDGDCSQTFTRK
jgi:hypothetical protein